MVIPERKRKRKRTKSHFSLISPVIDWTIGYKQNKTKQKKDLKRQFEMFIDPVFTASRPVGKQKCFLFRLLHKMFY